MTDVPSELAGCVGPVLFEGDPRVAGELAGANLAARHAPYAVVGATGAEDVVAAVRYAAANKYAIAVLSTGHSGTSHRECVVVTTGRMSSVTVDPVARTARVEAGVRWAQVVAAAAAHGLAPLNGSSPTVGAVGYTLGGGIGLLSRQYGYGADNVRSIDVVTADGQLRTVDAEHEPDLFWALRGGKGSFGIVTAMELDLFPVRRLYGGHIVYPGDRAATVLHDYRAWVRTLSDATTTSIALIKLPDLPHLPPPLRGKVTVHLRVAHDGSAAEGAAVVAPMRNGEPILLDTVRDMPYSEVATIHNDPTDPTSAWTSGVFVTHLSGDAIADLLDPAQAWFTQPFAIVEIRHLGGALSRQPAVPNAMAGRDAGFLVGVIAMIAPETANFVRSAGAALLDVFSAWECETVPLNWRNNSEDPRRAARGWLAADHQRLLDIKATYDPYNLFRGGFAVQPD
jgi:FAD/FMN-containing dehydrogenase